MRTQNRTATIVTAAVIVAALVGVSGTVGDTAWADSSLPYTTPQATGGITLCDTNGKLLTHGTVADKPFIWRAIGDTKAPAAYSAKGATATLFGYQPRQNVAAGQWSGEALTGSARFTNPTHPTAAATPADLSLADFISDYPPQWDGLLQVRIYLGAPNQAVYSRTYDETDIQVSGSTWQVIKGGKASCTDGDAVSDETLLLPSVAAMTTPPPEGSRASGAPNGGSSSVTAGSGHASAGAVAASGSGSAQSGTSATGGTATGSAALTTSVQAETAAHEAKSSSSGGYIFGVIAALAVIGLGVFVWLRKRSVGVH